MGTVDNAANGDSTMKKITLGGIANVVLAIICIVVIAFIIVTVHSIFR